MRPGLRQRVFRRRRNRNRSGSVGKSRIVDCLEVVGDRLVIAPARPLAAFGWLGGLLAFGDETAVLELLCGFGPELRVEHLFNEPWALAWQVRNSGFVRGVGSCFDICFIETDAWITCQRGGDSD